MNRIMLKLELVFSPMVIHHLRKIEQKKKEKSMENIESFLGWILQLSLSWLRRHEPRKERELLQILLIVEKAVANRNRC